jgi:hypothetical protein
MIFLLTSAAGSALMAVKFEEETRVAEEQSPEIEPPPYEDDPV